jgi:uncharacterized protein (DUF1800 family)
MDDGLRFQRLLGRATFGPRPGDRAALARLGAEAWLERELAAGGAQDPGLTTRLVAFPSLALEPGQAFQGMAPSGHGAARDREAIREMRNRGREIALQVAGARVVRAVHGDHGLREVMVDFWSNHFSVFARKSLIGGLLPHFQREVLDANGFGRFEDLLVQVARSPAMLVYLDNWNSTVPRFRGRRRSGRGGINENYARELLELHTLGVDGGYSQEDVRQVAHVFTGWTLESRREPIFRFRESMHDPGDKRVLGRRIRGGGMDEGEALLRRLARHPSTAHHLARKLVARFVADSPLPALVERVARRYRDTDGRIDETLKVVLLSPELADPGNRKLKTPLRFAVSALRATGGETDGGKAFLRALWKLGEVPFHATTPAGYPEEAEHWIDPGSLLERMRLAFALAAGQIRGTRLGPSQLGGAPVVIRGIRASESQALELASPEFQWA